MNCFYTLKKIQYIYASIQTLDYYYNNNQNKLDAKKNKKTFQFINKELNKIKQNKKTNINNIIKINNLYVFYSNIFLKLEKTKEIEENEFLFLFIQAQFSLHYYQFEKKFLETKNKKIYNLIKTLDIVLLKNINNITNYEKDFIKDSYFFSKISIINSIREQFTFEIKDKLEGLYGPKYFK